MSFSSTEAGLFVTFGELSLSSIILLVLNCSHWKEVVVMNHFMTMNEPPPHASAFLAHEYSRTGVIHGFCIRRLEDIGQDGY